VHAPRRDPHRVQRCPPSGASRLLATTQVQRLLHHLPIAPRDYDAAFATLPGDRHGRAVGDDAVHHRLGVGTGVGGGDGVHGTPCTTGRAMRQDLACPPSPAPQQQTAVLHPLPSVTLVADSTVQGLDGTALSQCWLEYRVPLGGAHRIPHCVLRELILNLARNLRRIARRCAPAPGRGSRRDTVWCRRVAGSGAGGGGG
jgi:hypothetical protein